MNYLVSGDPLAPGGTDLIAQTKSLAVGARVPDGWRVLSGNERESTIARVCFRYESEESTNYGALSQFDSTIREALRVDATRQDSGREPESAAEKTASDAIALLCRFDRESGR